MSEDQPATPSHWQPLLRFAQTLRTHNGQPLRLCLGFSHGAWAEPADKARAVAKTISRARAADELGIDSLWVSEDPDGWDAYAVLAALARETSRIRLGTAVVNPYMRHPNLIAASVATLDLISGGRAFLGLGRGQTEWYGRALGLPVHDPVGRLAETIDLLRQWWRPPHRASGGEPLTVNDWVRDIVPLQAQPPIYLAAAGPKALTIGATHADGIIFNSLTSNEFIAETVPRLRTKAANAGRDPDSLRFILRTEAIITPEPEKVWNQVKATIAMINALPGMERLLQSPGFDVQAIIDEVRRQMKTNRVLAHGGGFPDLRQAGDLDAAKAAIPNELVARLAIAGPRPDVEARLRELVALGITHVFLKA